MFCTWVSECGLAPNHVKSCPGSVCLLGGFFCLTDCKIVSESETITSYCDEHRYKMRSCDDLKNGWWSTEAEPLYLRSGLCLCSPQGAHGPQVNSSCLLCHASGLVWGVRAGYGDIVVVVASVASSSSLSDSALTKPADTVCTFFLQPSLDRNSL